MFLLRPQRRAAGIQLKQPDGEDGDDGGAVKQVEDLRLPVEDVDCELEEDVIEQAYPSAAISDTPSTADSKGEPRIHGQDFTPLRLIGKGAWGKVYLVKRHATGAVYAMKVLRKKEIIQQDRSQRVQQERLVLSHVHHPFIVSLRFAFQTPRKLYLLMDFIGGGELFGRIADSPELPEKEARFYAAEVTLALEHLHARDIIYRDLKPENVMIGTDGHIVLTDFGLAKEQATKDDSMTFCGTLEYMAPEIIRGQGSGKAADWWALGVMLCEMLTDTRPFDGDGPRGSAGNRHQTQQAILAGRFALPKKMSGPAKTIIRSLLNPSAKKRLGSTGAKGVKEHSFFKGTDWQGLETKRVKAPWVPPCKGPEDVSQFSARLTNAALSESLGGRTDSKDGSLLTRSSSTQNVLANASVPSAGSHSVADMRASAARAVGKLRELELEPSDLFRGFSFNGEPRI